MESPLFEIFEKGIMVEPKIVTTKLTQSGVQAPPPEELAKRHQTTTRKTVPSTESTAVRPAAPKRRRKELSAALWGVLLLVGGVGAWLVLSREEKPLPEAWKTISIEKGSDVGLMSGTGESDGNLLRLEWPAHPRAQGYVLRFMDGGGNGPAPIPVQGTVFLYDLDSDVLSLPGEFDWEVSALLPDGSHVVTPRSHYKKPQR